MSQAEKFWFAFGVTIGLNVAIEFFCFYQAASYYQPGNPVKPSRWGIDAMMLASVFMGIVQLIYVVPMALFAAMKQQWHFMKGVVLGAVITGLLNLALILLIF